eukprot:247053-Rhodomonas_salina.2
MMMRRTCLLGCLLASSLVATSLGFQMGSKPFSRGRLTAHTTSCRQPRTALVHMSAPITETPTVADTVSKTAQATLAPTAEDLVVLSIKEGVANVSKVYSPLWLHARAMRSPVLTCAVLHRDQAGGFGKLTTG